MNKTNCEKTRNKLKWGTNLGQRVEMIFGVFSGTGSMKKGNLNNNIG